MRFHVSSIRLLKSLETLNGRIQDEGGYQPCTKKHGNVETDEVEINPSDGVRIVAPVGVADNEERDPIDLDKLRRRKMINKDLLSNNSPHLPIDGFPYDFQEIVTTYAKALNCPVEFVVGAAISAAAQAMGNRFYWTDGKYTDYAQFYVALVGDVSANKTGSIKKMIQPLELADRLSVNEWQMQTAGMKNDERIKTPFQIRLMQDYTLEAYQDALKFNPDGVMVLADEILTFFDFNRYKKGCSDEKFFLSVLFNYMDYKKTRKGSGLDMISKPIARIIGGIQPDVLAASFGGSTMLADGMLPRFLWFEAPDDFRFDEELNKIPTERVKDGWNTIINRLLQSKCEIRLMFDADAQSKYNAYKIRHNKAKNAKTLYGYEASVCGKLEVYAIIWAMVSRVLRFVSLEENTMTGTIEIMGYDMDFSLRCMDYFQHTAMKIYDTITEGNRPKMKDCIVGLKDNIINQSQFAESIGVSHQYVNKLLKK